MLGILQIQGDFKWNINICIFVFTLSVSAFLHWLWHDLLAFVSISVFERPYLILSLIFSVTITIEHILPYQRVCPFLNRKDGKI